MNIGSGRRFALILAAATWAVTAGPLCVTPGEAQEAAAQPTAVGSAVDTSAAPAKASRHRSARRSEARSRRSDRTAAKKGADDSHAKAADTRTDTDAGKAADTSQPRDGHFENGATIPASVANANGEWPSPTAATDTYSMSSKAGSILGQMDSQPATSPGTSADNAQVVASDQLNELDRASADDKPQLTLAKATLDAPQEQVSSDNSPWDKTSLIGKIFIAFGGVLTMASAVRMFIA